MEYSKLLNSRISQIVIFRKLFLQHIIHHLGYDNFIKIAKNRISSTLSFERIVTQKIMQ